ncbi:MULTISPECIES: 3-hydroxyacyl-CoA dehydrogenase family protein [Streptomyces]|uniref:3-hydroxyacyl-CoA dehydrogenase family protein n=1 Tax=Streptomyces griseoaurantiacus TaxID=68213 RepID=A0A7W2DVE4_9ACTN|nr:MULTISPECIES: 3-hydroxyacyl-CoA dehydrogenase family protein [Streptomyces]MBA5223714.1 3-hydroxyacyl-CoA dehydrogenase family protein [Streptomyces griseoaurantiacus]MDX3091216.1 3-hydroxyacyl-CoA dehydrogenase family protein [Streptomyces sp. ME12-02E]MDX3334704.1 3-hydroxyacyl-CoA dehydrogenase family protein [Streptomyces sp. ME02-6978a]
MTIDSSTPVAVVGAGVMGAGLAQVAAAAGHEVVLHSRREATLRRALAGIGASLERAAARGGGARAEDPGTTLARIRTTTDLGDVAGCAVAVESVAEDVDLKRRVFAELDRLCPPGALLATNTSGIPVTEIAAATGRPGSVVGTHFFSPVPRMELCEIVRGRETTDAAVAAARSFAEGIGKSCVVVEKDLPGFVTTRLIIAFVLEAVRLVETGICRAEDVDRACRLAFGHAMGPLATADQAGLDVLRGVAAGLAKEYTHPVFATPGLLDRLVAEGRHGRKTGRGFHVYDDTTPAPTRP